MGWSIIAAYRVQCIVRTPEGRALPGGSELDRLLEPGRFLWATGIEDTFIVEPSKRTGRTLDEYELTGHYERWREDIDLMASLGISTARYGIPWYRIQPERHKWDWSWPDQTLDRLLEKGVEPIVDLVHYGVPGWLDGSLLHPDFPELMAEYGSRVAERYRGSVRWYTPLNEPRINAWYAGKLGWWPPHRRGWKGFTAVSVSLARAVSLTHRALKDADAENVCVHVDPADLYFTRDRALDAEVSFRQELVFLSLDMVTGRVDSGHPMWSWLLQHGATPDALDRLREIAVQPDVMGINCYPLFGQKEVMRGSKGVLLRNRYAGGELLHTLVKRFWERYRIPLMVTETASIGRKRVPWLEESVEAVKRLRAEGVPVVGYTWWPLFSLIGWAYQHSARDFDRYMVHLGLWELDASLKRTATPVAERFKALAQAGTAAVGEMRVESTRGRHAVAHS